MTTRQPVCVVVWTKAAETDLESIIEFIADDSIDTALAGKNAA